MREFTEGLPFAQLGLSPELLRALDKRGFSTSTPVQAGCIPPMLAMRDVIVKAPTGTGKTFAFGLPLIMSIAQDRTDVQALVLAPTRELAMQITTELRSVLLYLPGLRTVCLYGGQPIARQIEALKRKPQLIVATPGRLSDHLKRRTVRLDSVQTVVLDEADRMLDMGFVQDVTRILDKTAQRRNLGMFSATMSREVLDISWMYQRDPEEIVVQAQQENKPNILQYCIEVEQSKKILAAAELIRGEQLQRVIAFCNTKDMADRLAKYLQISGIEAKCLHGDMQQKERERVMTAFRSGAVPVLIATDVAARGIDIDDVDSVINYDVPLENEYYIHRIGRTGRAKRRGVAYTLIADYPSRVRMETIQKLTGSDIRCAVLDAQGRVVEK